MAAEPRETVAAAPPAADPEPTAEGVLAPFLRRDFLLKVAFVVGLFVWPLLFRNLYGLSVMTTAGFFAILTMAVGVILGQAGQLSFGHAAFYGIGAYTTALLTINYEMPSVVGFLAAPVVPAVIALVIGRPVLRLRYFYLALATIGLGQIFIVMVLQLRDITGGEHGMGPIPALNLFGYEFDSYLGEYYLVWVFVILIVLFTQRALKYRVGRSLRALATSEIAASTLGVRNANWKLMAFVVSAAYCGLAGGLFAVSTTAISVNSFTFGAAVLPVVMMLVGGDRSLWGGIVGAIVITWVGTGFSGAQQYSGVIFSVIMILLLIFLPGGILGGLSPAQRARLRSWFRMERRPDVVVCATAAETDAPADQCETEIGLPAASVPASSSGSTNVVGDISDPGLRPVGESDGVLAAAPLSALPVGADAAEAVELMRVEGVSVDFGGLRAVNDVSLSVREGQIAALIGPNGAGKTTLFNVISRLQEPTVGRVFVGDVEVTRLSPAETARLGVARTFQNLRIFPNMSVLENVLVGCHRHERSGILAGGLGLPRQRAEERESRARAQRALAVVGLEGDAHKPAASLPYGKQRLVEISRALASEPRLLLLDEPAAGMNAEERAYLVERIRRIRDEGITVVLVEHDIELVMGISEDVSVLDYGALIARGRPEIVREDRAVIEAYLGVERGRDHDLCATRDLVEHRPEPLLSVDGLSTSYGVIEALRDVSLEVGKGEVLAVLGANGAGKTTLLHTISGVLRSKKGRITYRGADITRLSPEKITARGLCHVPEGRQLFPTLTVQDNLVLGSSGRKRDKAGLADDIAYVYELFPILGERRTQAAGTLSGGEQQMLAIGRALMGKPSLLVLDEPSMGLAPMAVENIFEALAKLNQQGLTMLMVEQNAEMALSVAHRGIVLQTGSVALSGIATELRQDDRVRECYLGQGQG